MKKVFTILIIMSILSLFVGVRNSLAYGELSVEISDNYIGHSPQYKITFITPTSLKKGDNLKLTFDEQVYLRTENIQGRTENIQGKITVNGKELLDNLRVSNDSVEIVLPFDLNSGETLQIVIAQDVLVSPSSPCYLRVILTLDGVDYNSNYYKITDLTTIKDLNLSILEDSYKINFSIRNYGSLEGYKAEIETPSTDIKVTPKDYIYIRFSPLLSQSFSSFLSKYEITINGTQPPASPELTVRYKDSLNEQKEVKVIVPKNIYGDVEIKIKGFNRKIAIPETLSGDAFVGIWTSKQTAAVKSNVISIQGSYVVKTNYEISPSEPEGENDFYKTIPTLALTPEKGSLIESINTYCKIDDADFSLYKEPLVISQGIHNVQFYSVGLIKGKEYKEPIQTLNFKIDTELPLINVLSPLESESRLYNLHISIIEANIKTVEVQVRGITFTYFGNDVMLPLFLFDDSTQINVVVKDLAGYESNASFTITLGNK